MLSNTKCLYRFLHKAASNSGELSSSKYINLIAIVPNVTAKTYFLGDTTGYYQRKGVMKDSIYRTGLI